MFSVFLIRRWQKLGLILLGSALFVIASGLLSGCNSAPELQTYQIKGPIMGTEYHVTLVLAPEQAALVDELAQGILARLQEVDRLMSTYKEDSELSRFNRAAVHVDMPLSAPTQEVMQLAQVVHQQSDGAFDPSIAPLVDLWGFGPQTPLDQVPPKAQIDQALAQVGLDAVILDAQTSSLRKTAPRHLDFSAIAKGYAVDRVADYLKAQGIVDFLAEVGGELIASGRKADASLWRIAIEKPQLAGRSVQKVLMLADLAVATSGDYRNYFEADGQRYSHTLDPRTGYPIRHNLASVTVVHPSCALADAYATALMVMGEQAGMALAEKLNLSVYMLVKIPEGFQAYQSPAFVQMFGE